MLHQVLKKFKAEGTNRLPGEIIETSHWHNERLLLEHRFIGKVSVAQQNASKVEAGANALDITQEEQLEEVPTETTETVSPEPPKTVSTESVPPVVRKPASVVGRVPVATKAKKVTNNG